MSEESKWGLLGRMTAKPGKRAELIAALQESSANVPGKLLYLIQLEAGTRRPRDPHVKPVNDQPFHFALLRHFTPLHFA